MTIKNLPSFGKAALMGMGAVALVAVWGGLAGGGGVLAEPGSGTTSATNAFERFGALRAVAGSSAGWAAGRPHPTFMRPMSTWSPCGDYVTSLAAPLSSNSSQAGAATARRLRRCGRPRRRARAVWGRSGRTHAG